jgi:predicted GTPase
LIKVRSEILTYDKHEQERKRIEKELKEKNGKDKHSNGAKVWKSKSLLSNDKNNKPAIRLTGKVSHIGKTRTTKVVKKSKRI